ncbi:MAG: DUF998 domain-containing protein [Methanoregula sp.]
MQYRKTLAGGLMFLGTSWFILGIIVSEALYPGYTATKMLSDLGVGQTAGIYNSSIIIFGLCLFTSAYLLWIDKQLRYIAVLLGLAGLGAVGVGFLPETLGTPHVVVALTVFICGGIAAVLSFRVFRQPFKWFSLVLGIVILAATVLILAVIILKFPVIIGNGGVERMIAYPFFIWALGTGGYLIAEGD